MHPQTALLAYVTRLGDNALVLGQRLCEAITQCPELEEELANANFALDYLGQARMFYSYAGELEGRGRCEDDFAFLRDDNEYRNLLLVEQPNGHFGDIVVRQFLFESWYVLQLDALRQCSDAKLAAISARAYREIQYHLRHVSAWMLRLGDGTAESHRRMTASLQRLWPYSGEAFAGDAVDAAVSEHLRGPDLAGLRKQWQRNVAAVLEAATLGMPADAWMDGGGREGRHSEHFGYLLAEMQHLQRVFPGASW